MSDDTTKNVDVHFETLKRKWDKYILKVTEDDILIIKSHLICESYLEQMLILEKKCTHTELQDLTFKKKLDKTSFSNSSPFNRCFYHLTNQLNKIRNRIGHELEYKISESDVDSMGYIIGEDYILEKYKNVSDNHQALLKYCLKRAVMMASIILEDLINKKIQKESQESSS